MTFIEWLRTVRCEHETAAHLEWLHELYDEYEEPEEAPTDSE